jgi:predicted ferric reductase
VSTTLLPPLPVPAGPTPESPVRLDARRARTDSGVRTAALVALWGSLLLVSYWWATGGGIQALTSWADGLTSAGRLTGLLASALLLVQVLLMARVPVLERAFGQDRLAKVHRLVGFWSFDLMVAHIGLITWGYASGELSRTPGELWDLTVTYPGMLLAVAGTACLVMVVATSIKLARRRLRYESWHLLHLYAYLGVGLALPHQLWTGQDFLASTGRTVFWWGLYIAAAGAVLVWRVALPLWRTARASLRVTSVVREGAGVVSVYMAGRPGAVPVEAGQFYNFRFLTGRGWSRANPYSLSAAPDGRSLRITAKVVGDGSAALTRLHRGTRVLVEGPYGRLSARARTRPRVALIGAGVGVTPLRALAEALEYAPGDAVLLYRFSGRPLFERELQVLAAERGLQVLWLPGPRRAPGSWLGRGVGSASDLTALRYWVPDIAERDVYVCGPEPWADDVRRTTEAAGLPADRFHVESFGW